MSLRSAAVAVLCLVALPAFARGPSVDDFRTATPAELAMKSVPFAPGAAAVLLDWVRAHDDSGAAADDLEYFRIKVLTDEGKKYGDVELPYLGFYSSFGRIEARVTKPDGTVVPFTGKILDKLLVKFGGTRVSAKTFSLPDVQPGSIIEVRTRLIGSALTIRSTNFVVQRELPVIHELIWLKPYARTYSSFFTFGGLPPGKKPALVHDHYELELENVPAFEEEPFSPPEREIKPFVNFFYTLGQTEPAAFWQRQSDQLAESIEPFMTGVRNRSALQKEADAAAAGAATPTEKLQRLYARVQQLRNLSFERERTEAEEKKLRDNNNIDDVLRNGYGYSVEINRLFVGLARLAGFTANVVRVGERDDHFLAKNLPVGDQLDGEVAAVTVDGKDLFLDPGTRYAPFGTLQWSKSGVPGLRVAKKAPLEWVQTPLAAASAALLSRRAVLRLEEGVIKGRVTLTFDGQSALSERLLYHDQDAAAVNKAFEEKTKTWFPEGSNVKVVSVTGLNESGKPVVAELDVDTSSLGAFTGARALLPPSVFAASSKNPFAAEKRKYVVYFDFPNVVEDDVTLQVPAGYIVESLPQPLKLDAGSLFYENHTTNDAREVHFTRRLEVRSVMLDPYQYQALRKFYGKVTAADQDQLVLKKTETR